MKLFCYNYSVQQSYEIFFSKNKSIFKADKKSQEKDIILQLDVFFYLRRNGFETTIFWKKLKDLKMISSEKFKKTLRGI